MTEELSVELREAVVTACGTAFYYKAPLRSLFLAAGVPGPVFDRYHDESKYKIARNILGDLDVLGERGRAIKRRLVVELAGMSEPMPDADPTEGRRALQRVRELAMAGRIVVDAEQDKVEARQKRRRLQEQARAENARKTTELRTRFHELVSTPGSKQRRGYDFEELLAALFATNDIPFRPSFRTGTEQIDGAFKFGGFDYLVEARWRKDAPGVNDLFALAGKVESKVASTRGLFISMVTYRPEVVDQVVSMTKRVILVDGQDLALIFEGMVSLADALEVKTAKAAQEGLIFFPLAALSR
jgi:hypothetical protein